MRHRRCATPLRNKICLMEISFGNYYYDLSEKCGRSGGFITIRIYVYYVYALPFLASPVWYLHVPWLITDLCCVLDDGSVEWWCEKEGNLAEIILLLYSVGVVGGKRWVSTLKNWKIIFIFGILQRICNARLLPEVFYVYALFVTLIDTKG